MAGSSDQNLRASILQFEERFKQDQQRRHGLTAVEAPPTTESAALGASRSAEAPAAPPAAPEVVSPLRFREVLPLPGQGAWVSAAADALPQSPRYRCPKCGEAFVGWGLRRAHLQSRTCKRVPASRDARQAEADRCRLRDRKHVQRWARCLGLAQALEDETRALEQLLLLRAHPPPPGCQQRQEEEGKAPAILPQASLAEQAVGCQQTDCQHQQGCKEEDTPPPTPPPDEEAVARQRLAVLRSRNFFAEQLFSRLHANFICRNIAPRFGMQSLFEDGGSLLRDHHHTGGSMARGAPRRSVELPLDWVHPRPHKTAVAHRQLMLEQNISLPNVYAAFCGHAGAALECGHG